LIQSNMKLEQKLKEAIIFKQQKSVEIKFDQKAI
jgi:hypothetical protein